MPYSFQRCVREVLAPLDPTWSEHRPQLAFDFEPPERTPFTVALEEATVGVLASCGVYAPHQQPFEETQDLSIRVLDRDEPFSGLRFAHLSPIRAYADRDLNVAYPIERLAELEAVGTIGKLAQRNASILGSISLYTGLVEETAPQLIDLYRSEGVDLLLVLPFCPGCHRAVSILARAIERRGLPTVMTSTLRETSEAIKAPRTAFLDYPLGCPAGRVGDPGNQRAVLQEVLQGASSYGEPWAIRDLDFVYSADGGRDWEREVDQLYLDDVNGRGTFRQHQATHRSTGEDLSGKEREFAIRCYC